ncbi:MAG: hypothetical protein COB26_11995 [Piscirickettsiaceae bacterium]|nr:MAG: hypothetical protein COB26_11995 [Piscirickettsiaceae bacterium]
MSSYVQSVIGSGEKVEYEAKVSMWSLLPLFVVGLLLIWVYGLGLIFWAIAIMRYMTTELVITDKKIISKFGFIKRDTIEMLLPKIESIQVNQSVLGRMLNYGSVVVSGAGNPQAPVPGIASPIEFRKKFMEIQEEATNKA